MANIGHYISGKHYEGKSNLNKPVFNPATGASETKVNLANNDEVNLAVESSKSALKDCSNQPPLRRARLLDKFKYILDERREELAQCISSEHGKTHEDALGEVTRGLEVVEFAVGAPHLLKGDYTENVGSEVDSFNVRQSLGVVAGITPFNFPAMVPMWMFPIALVCGNCFILKPSERDPSPSLLIAKWLTEAGLPDGVFNVVQGDKIAVDAILNHRDIKSICFVGSRDLNAEMVRQGWALAYQKYSTDYVIQEKVAQSERTGIWSGQFVSPWDWRRGKRERQMAGKPRPPD